MPVANAVPRTALARVNAVSSTPIAVAAAPGHARCNNGSPWSRTAAITVAQPTPNSRATAATACPSRPTRRQAWARARSVHDARRDRRMRFGPGLLLTLGMHAPPDAFDPHQRHPSIPGRQITHPRRAAIMQPRDRPAYRTPADRRGCLNRVLQFTIVLGHRQHGHAFQPKHHHRTTVVIHLGPFHSCSLTPRIMRPQAHSQGQADNRVTRPLPSFIAKTRQMRARVARADAESHCARPACAILRLLAALLLRAMRREP